MKRKSSSRKIGIWLAGARGDIATTLIVGTLAVRAGRVSSSGMVTEIPPINELDLADLDSLVFGGLDIIEDSLVDTARVVARRSGTYTYELIDAIESDLQTIDADIVYEPTALWGPDSPVETRPNMSMFVSRIRGHLKRFKERHALEHLVVVNLTSSESLPVETEAHETKAGIEQLIEDNRSESLTPSICYTQAAFLEGCSYINFTPNPGSDLKGLHELADQQGVPFYGNDGKTGETLVKTALAPMFAYRNLRVLSWEGTNMLGNGDGKTLDDPDHKVAKLRNKGNVLDSILGYSPHGGIDINYVPSLGDWKTAWDLIHFQGFLDVKMTMQFTWQGCDSILAAPLVLDMIRLSEFAARQGESGPMYHLAAYFKNPIDCDELALYPQFQLLLEYVDAHLQRNTGAANLESIG